MVRGKAAETPPATQDENGGDYAPSEDLSSNEMAGAVTDPGETSGPNEVVDHITAAERNLERLQRIAEEAEFESGTLVGDIRDGLLDVFKSRLKPWSQMSQGEQADLNRTLESIAKTVLRKLVVVLAEEEDVSVHATLKGYAVDGETFKLKVVAKGDEETATELFRMDGHEVILIRADARRHYGQKRDAETHPDQPGLGFSDPPKAEEELPPPPADDSDLAGEDPDEE